MRRQMLGLDRSYSTVAPTDEEPETKTRAREVTKSGRLFFSKALLTALSLCRGGNKSAATLRAPGEKRPEDGWAREIVSLKLSLFFTSKAKSCWNQHTFFKTSALWGSNSHLSSTPSPSPHITLNSRFSTPTSPPEPQTLLELFRVQNRIRFLTFKTNVPLLICSNLFLISRT